MQGLRLGGFFRGAGFRGLGIGVVRVHGSGFGVSNFGALGFGVQGLASKLSRFGVVGVGFRV